VIVAAPPPPTIVAAAKAVYPRSPVRVTRICRVEDLALVRVRVRGRAAYVAVQQVRRGWRAVWVNGRLVRRVPSAQRASIGARVARLKTRCLAP
jgi:hypothetical protein